MNGFATVLLQPLSLRPVLVSIRQMPVNLHHKVRAKNVMECKSSGKIIKLQYCFLLYAQLQRPMAINIWNNDVLRPRVYDLLNPVESTSASRVNRFVINNDKIMSPQSVMQGMAVNNYLSCLTLCFNYPRIAFALTNFNYG
ncbi:MAG: hypothetical protein EZS28_003678 [Streblomastix strix]|uniref:Uncharacterized protein n=1 Tax=Streblomastix strix TaxID=222440 RepID=A0A5J4X2V2_9EUKA|nr:MAG: hypothetical protein EZS28_003678 [Streblomastix strix]